MLDQPQTTQRVVEAAPVDAEGFFGVERVPRREVQTTGGQGGVVDRTLDEAADRIADRGANPEGFRRVGTVTEDGRAGGGVKDGAVHAVVRGGLGRHRSDDVVDLDFIVIEHQAEVREPARLDGSREGEGFRFFRLQERVTARDARDARGVGRQEVVGRGRGGAAEVERQALGRGQSGTVVDPVLTDLGIGLSRDLGRRAGVNEAVGERLAVGREVLVQVRHAHRGVEAGLEGDVADRAVDQVHAIHVQGADGGVVGVAVRTAELGVLTQPAVTEQRHRQFGEHFVAGVFGAGEVRTGVQEQEATVGVGIAAHAFGVLTAVLGAQGDTDRTGAPEVPQLASDRRDELLLFVAFGDGDRGVDVVQGFLALVAHAEDVQRGAVVDRGLAVALQRADVVTGEHAGAEGGGQATGVDQLRAADDGARSADFTGDVDDRVGGEGEAERVNALLGVLDLDFTVGVADVPVDVVDEQQAVKRTTSAHNEAAQHALVGLGAVRAEHGVTGQLGQDRTGGLAARGRRGRAVGRHHVVRDGVANQGRQESVVRPAQVDRLHAPDRIQLVRAIRRVVEVEVEEGRLRDIEVVFDDVLGFSVQVDVVGEREVGADLEALRFRFRDARQGREGGRVHAVATVVVRTADAGVADALAEVSQARGRAVVPVGVARSDRIAARGVGEVAARAREVRNVRIAGRAERRLVHDGGLTPQRTVHTNRVAEQVGVDAVVVVRTDRRRGRISVDTQQVVAVVDPVDVERGDLVLLFVLGVAVQVQAVVEEVLADQDRDATRGLAAVVDLAVVGVDFQTFEVLAQDEVQHARDGVSAVNRRSAAGDDFNVLDQQTRDLVDVDGQRAAARTHVTATVNQGQGAVGTQRAQVGERQTRVVQARAGGVRRNQRVAQGRDGGQVIDDRGLTGGQQLFTVNRDQRGRRVGRVTTDTRTGDDHFLDLGHVLVGLTLNRNARELALGEGRSRHSHDPGQDRSAKEILALD